MQLRLSEEIASLRARWDSKLAKIDKLLFKCLRQDDGATYFGQLTKVLPHEKKPILSDTAASAGELPPGFVAGKEASDPWIVYDANEVPEELQNLLILMRHGFGIHIYNSGSERYAGDWVFNKRNG